MYPVWRKRCASEHIKVLATISSSIWFSFSHIEHICSYSSNFERQLKVPNSHCSHLTALHLWNRHLARCDSCGPAVFELKRQVIFYISSQHTHSMVGQGEDQNSQLSHGHNEGMGTMPPILLSGSNCLTHCCWLLVLPSENSLLFVFKDATDEKKNAPSGLYSFHCTLQTGINVNA